MSAVGRIAVTLTLLLGASGCVGSTAEPVGYEPVPDEQLFTEVADLPGVRAATLGYEDSFAHPGEYFGEVRVGRSVDLVETLDAVSAILWQGRPDPTVVVTVRGSQGEVDNASVRLINPPDLEARYGPQPGTGEVPADAEPLPRPPGLP